MAWKLRHVCGRAIWHTSWSIFVLISARDRCLFLNVRRCLRLGLHWRPHGCWRPICHVVLHPASQWAIRPQTRHCCDYIAGHQVPWLATSTTWLWKDVLSLEDFYYINVLKRYNLHNNSMSVSTACKVQLPIELQILDAATHHQYRATIGQSRPHVCKTTLQRSNTTSRHRWCWARTSSTHFATPVELHPTS